MQNEDKTYEEVIALKNSLMDGAREYAEKIGENDELYINALASMRAVLLHLKGVRAA